MYFFKFSFNTKSVEPAAETKRGGGGGGGLEFVF